VEQLSFASVIGYLLGLLILFVVARIFFTPIKMLLRLLFNSALGMCFLFLLNLCTPFTGIYIGVNPITSVVVGAMGLPGVCLLLLLQIFF